MPAGRIVSGGTRLGVKKPRVRASRAKRPLVDTAGRVVGYVGAHGHIHMLTGRLPR